MNVKTVSLAALAAIATTFSAGCVSALPSATLSDEQSAVANVAGATNALRVSEAGIAYAGTGDTGVFTATTDAVDAVLEGKMGGGSISPNGQITFLTQSNVTATGVNITFGEPVIEDGVVTTPLASLTAETLSLDPAAVAAERTNAINAFGDIAETYVAASIAQNEANRDLWLGFADTIETIAPTISADIRGIVESLSAPE